MRRGGKEGKESIREASRRAAPRRAETTGGGTFTLRNVAGEEEDRSRGPRANGRTVGVQFRRRGTTRRLTR